MKEQIAQKDAEADRDKRRRKRLDEELKDLKSQLEKRLHEQGGLNRALEESKDKIKKLEIQRRIPGAPWRSRCRRWTRFL